MIRFSAECAGLIPLDLSFDVAEGELLALVGHSGSGKTTILRTIAGLWTPTAARVEAGGQVWLDTAAGVNLGAHQRQVGVVFQNYALFPHMSAARNVMAAMPTGTRDKRTEAEHLLDMVNLHGLAARKPAELSGGQQQRVALARALARKPQVLLLDEPFSAVDRATRDRLHSELMALRADLRMPVILVTHDMAEAQALADRLVVIEKGSVIRQGPTAEVMSDPAALRAMGLRELSATLPARVVAHDADGLTHLETATGPIWLPRLNAETGAVVRVRIMAHEVILARTRPEGLSAQNILPAIITRIVAGEGPGVIVHLSIGGDEVFARITRRAAASLGLEVGQEAYMVLKSMSVARDHIGAVR